MRTAPTRGRASTWTRLLIAAMLTALVIPALITVFSSAAHAEDDKPDSNYSMYNLASNTGAYFSNENSPDSEGGQKDGANERMTKDWLEVTEDPGSAGSMLGYADSDVSWSLDWLAAKMSGSSQTFGYDTFKAQDDNGHGVGFYDGLMDYSHFGAANNDLGFDSMSSGSGSNFVQKLGGSIIWILYALSMSVSWLFWIVIQILKHLNPFLLLHDGLASISPAYAKWADGMTQGQTAPGELSGLSAFIAQWYGALITMSWAVLVPLFIGVLLLSLVLFKKLNRGSAIKKLIIRVVFIGVGVPLIGSMYTSILNQFDDSMLSQNSGPTKVVLSTYVDFNSWINHDRLAIPDNADISWDADEGHALPKSVLSARSSAAAINVQSHGGDKGVFKNVTVDPMTDDAATSWSNASPDLEDGETDQNTVMATLNMLNGYIGGNSVSASDFESGVKGNITQLSEDQVTQKDKSSWFNKDGGYADAQKKFGEGKVKPQDHPIISNGFAEGHPGLTSSSPGSSQKTFTTGGGTTTDCGYKVVDSEGKPMSCNLSALATYNYLNTGFDDNALTLYSSEKATSGFTRESHDAVSQVGTGPAAFMYWANAVVLLGSIVVVGYLYGIGMLYGAFKHLIQVVGAVIPATAGSLAGISKFIIYAVAMILEVFATMFLYQLVSEFLVSLPTIIEGPASNLVNNNAVNGVISIFSNKALGSVAVTVMTVVTTLLIAGVTFAMVRARKSILTALNEVTTKLVDKFMETNTMPPTGGSTPGAGMMPSVAGGIGSGAGMAMASGMMDKPSGPPPPTSPGFSGRPGGGPGHSPSNAGGTNSQTSLAGPGARQALVSGGSGDNGGPGNPGLPGDGSPGELGPGGAHGSGVPGANGQTGLPGTGDSDGSQIQSNQGRPHQAQEDRALADRVHGQGGLSDLGVTETSSSTDAGGTNGSGSAGGLVPGTRSSQGFRAGTPGSRTAGIGGSATRGQDGTGQGAGRTGRNPSQAKNGSGVILSGNAGGTNGKPSAPRPAPQSNGTSGPGRTNGTRPTPPGSGPISNQAPQRLGKNSTPAAGTEKSRPNRPGPSAAAPASTPSRSAPTPTRSQPSVPSKIAPQPKPASSPVQKPTQRPVNQPQQPSQQPEAAQPRRRVVPKPRGKNSTDT
jgi:hypothetical protein